MIKQVLRRFQLPALGLLAGLAACSSNEVEFVLTCPQVLIVEETSRLTQYLPGEGRDMLDVRFNAEIGSVNWACEFFVEESRVEIGVRYAMLAMRGPAAQDSVARFPYFVAVADPQGNILAKQAFAIEIQFPGNALEIGHIETIYQTLQYAQLSQAANYTIYIGFQLTPEQIEEVRARQ